MNKANTNGANVMMLWNTKDKVIGSNPSITKLPQLAPWTLPPHLLSCLNLTIFDQTEAKIILLYYII